VPLTEHRNGIDRSSAEKPEIACVHRDPLPADCVNDAVKTVRRYFLEPAFARPRRPSSEHDIGLILAPAFDQDRNEFRWVLQVCINHDDCIAMAVVEPGCQCYFLAEIPTQIDDRDRGVAFAERSQYRKCIVAAAVIDVNDLAPLPQFRSNIRQAPVEFSDPVSFVIGRDDNRDQIQLGAGGRRVFHVGAEPPGPAIG